MEEPTLDILSGVPDLSGPTVTDVQLLMFLQLMKNRIESSTNIKDISFFSLGTIVRVVFLLIESIKKIHFD